MWSFPSGFPHQCLDSFINPTMRAALPAHHILQLINPIYLTFREKYSEAPPAVLKISVASLRSKYLRRN